jgi:hypothetical protein
MSRIFEMCSKPEIFWAFLYIGRFWAILKAFETSSRSVHWLFEIVEAGPAFDFPNVLKFKYLIYRTSESTTNLQRLLFGS